MSVAVLITYRDEAAPGGPTYLPLATEDVFATHWLPAARALGCEWLPLFQTGAPVPGEDLPTVLGELRRLRDHFAAAGPPALHQRSAWLVDQLEALAPSTIRDVWIG